MARKGWKMIASVLRLNRSDCKALKITDAYSIHRVVYDLFPGEQRDFLYADKGGNFNERTILILSENEPKKPELGAVTIKIVPKNFLESEYFVFQVVLNPTKREKASGKTVAILGRDNLHQWVIKKAATHGFEIEAESLEVRHIGVQAFPCDGKTITHNSATFIGKLKVIDKVKFEESFRKGVGRAKGFGFGLMQIAPMNK